MIVMVFGRVASLTNLLHKGSECMEEAVITVGRLLNKIIKVHTRYAKFREGWTTSTRCTWVLKTYETHR